MMAYYSRILIAYDGSEMSKKALKMAEALAVQDEKIEIRVVSVFTPPTTLGNFAIFTEELYDKLRESTQEVVKKASQALKKLPNHIQTNVLRGNAGHMIVGYAKEYDCDLIVMGSRGLSGLKEVLVGSTSHYVVQHAHCPVLVAK